MEHGFHEPETVTSARSNYTHPAAFPTQSQHRGGKGKAISSHPLVLKKPLSHMAPYWKTEIAPLCAFVCLAGRKESAPGKTNPKGLAIQTLPVIHEEPPMHIFVLPFSGVHLGEPQLLPPSGLSARPWAGSAIHAGSCQGLWKT